MSEFSLPKVGEKTTWLDMPVHADALFLAQKLPKKQTVMILTDTAEQALRLRDAMAFYAPGRSCAYLPDWETLPYDHFSPQQDLISERLATLWQLKNDQVDWVLMTVSTAMQLLPPVDFVLGRTFWVRAGDRLDAERLRSNLVEAGYQSVTQVVSAGEFSMRGGLLDVYPMGSAAPYRIDLFDDEIDSIKVFDVDSQRTQHPVTEVRILPAHEFPTDVAVQTLFRQRFREEINSNPMEAKVYQDVSKGLFGAGVEYYFPLFFETEPATVLDYLGDDALIVWHGDVPKTAALFWADVKSRHHLAETDTLYPPLPPNQLYLSEDVFMGKLKPYAQLALSFDERKDALPNIAVDRKLDNPLQAFGAFQDDFQGKTLICVESAGRRETVSQFFQEYGFKAKTCTDWQSFISQKEGLFLGVAPLTNGYCLPDQHLAIVTEADLYQHVARGRKVRKKTAVNTDALLRDLAEIKVGDPVVHEDHGIGRYMGLVTLDLGEGNTELMLLEYADGGQLYVPVAQLHVISRYAGQAHEDVHLHKLGNASWDKAKRRAAEKARDTAAELLNLYAQRAAQEGFQYALNESDYQAFADGFGYEETQDQAAAIAAVLKDLTSTKPMDRLVCGDVGFGKTEVALRAAFVAVMGGKQVAILAPTTLLVEQHFQNFSDRFADFPIKVAQLSRFNSSKETKQSLAGIADGSVDIVIGTHKLIQPDVAFKNLGLVVIDEEHRFGVRQKEQLKRLRTNVDILALTATPIPRTLSMALEGLRDFSIIATPPQRRLSVKTFVQPAAEGVVREALLRELKRGGQVFFLHNEVSTIENMHERLAELMPEARIAVAHGQMRERELEQVMRDFLQQKFNVLLCSTIIETGIDIPNANTIIINRADKFGLAQLHQLRGRVGRSHHQAYAYLLTPEFISKDAEKRLEAIQMAGELGAGFTLAMQDLEIRGAGEILGDGQSGEMIQVGFTLYTEMLKQAVRDLKNGRVPDLDAPLGVTTEIKLHSPALLPEEYCPDIHERLVLYKRLAACEEPEEIDAVHEELIDRFGLPPQPAKTLIESHRIRLLAAQMGVDQLDASASNITVTMSKNHRIDPVHIISLIQTQKAYHLAGPDKLKVDIDIEEIDKRIVRVKALMSELNVPDLSDLTAKAADVSEATPKKKGKFANKTKK